MILNISRVVPNEKRMDLPMFYGVSIDKIHEVMDGDLGQELNAEIEEKLQVKIIGKYLDLGHGSVFTTETPVNSLLDLKGLTLRVPGHQLQKFAMTNSMSSPFLFPLLEYQFS